MNQPEVKYDSVIVDSHILAYSSWWPVKDLTTKAGVHTGLEFGFLKNTLATFRENYPTKIVMAWDGHPSRGLAIFPEYKAGRDKSKQENEAPWGPRIDRLRQVTIPIIQCLYHDDLEADEQIARYCHEQTTQGKKTLILSNDGDMRQLVSDLTHAKTTHYGIMDPAKVLEVDGVQPAKIPFIKAIGGDASDNIKGVPRVAADVKVRLAAMSNSIEELLANIDKIDGVTPLTRGKLIAGKELISRNYQICNLLNQTTSPTYLPPPTRNIAPAMLLCQELELASLYERKEWRLFQESLT